MPKLEQTSFLHFCIIREYQLIYRLLGPQICFASLLAVRIPPLPTGRTQITTHTSNGQTLRNQGVSSLSIFAYDDLRHQRQSFLLIIKHIVGEIYMGPEFSATQLANNVPATGLALVRLCLRACSFSRDLSSLLPPLHIRWHLLAQRCTWRFCAERFLPRCQGLHLVDFEGSFETLKLATRVVLCCGEFPTEFPTYRKVAEVPCP